MKKYFQVLGGVIAILIIAFILLLVWTKIRINNGDLVKWENKWYTKEELKEAFPPQYIEVEAANTPEEVYAKFRQALLDNDIEIALGQIREEKREKYGVIFSEYLLENNSLRKLGEIYPLEIKESSQYGNFSSYSYRFLQDGKEISSSMEFEKNSEGYWQIDQI